MSQVVETRTRVRKNFGKIAKIIDIPNLIDMQKQSYERFLQKDTPPDRRQETGLQGVFKSVFPIRDFSGTSSLEFVSYTFGEVKYEVDECLARGMTYKAPVTLTVRLVVYDQDKESGTQSIRDIKEQEIYFGTLPLMTARGTFIVNGTERVVVSQLHRSPGIFFDHDKGRTHSSGKLLFSARIIPLRGSWIDLEFDPKDILYVRIDRRRKFPVTLLLKALGYSAAELLEYMYKREVFELEGERAYLRIVPDMLMGREVARDILDPETGKVLVKAGKKVSRRALNRLAECSAQRVDVDAEELIGRYAACDIADPQTGEIIVGLNQAIGNETLLKMRAAGIRELPTLFIDGMHVSSSFRDTLELDKVETSDDAIVDIYRKLRPSNPPTHEVARTFFHNLFFSPEHYDLSAVGRLKLNLRLGLDVPEDVRTLRREDILRAMALLIELKDSEGQVDDIDHLGNRRVRAVGELLENQYRIGLVRMERAIKERMSLQEIEALMPHDLINSKPVSAVVKEFFGTSQLSQFMDQTNPLSEVTHKRRLSALGPGGLTRERAGFEVRDVHRDSGGSQHRADREPVHLRPGQRLRLHRDPLPHGGRGTGHQRRALPLRPGRGRPRHSPGQRAPGRQRQLQERHRQRAPHGRVHHGRPRRGGVHGRQPQPAGFGGGVPGPLPGKRRRQPRPDGLQHAAPGRSALTHRRSPGGHRHRVGGGPRLGRLRGGRGRGHDKRRGRRAHRGAL
jgi:DNA-directed RNA polymerase subunit beta